MTPLQETGGDLLHWAQFLVGFVWMNLLLAIALKKKSSTAAILAISSSIYFLTTTPFSFQIKITPVQIKITPISIKITSVQIKITPVQIKITLIQINIILSIWFCFYIIVRKYIKYEMFVIYYL